MITVPNRAALVLGGANGLGALVAKRLIRSGHHVLLTSRHYEEGWQTAHDLMKSTGRPTFASSFQLDIVDPGSRTQLAAHIETEMDQRLDVLVNAIGACPSGWSEEEWDIAMAANYQGPMQLLQSLAPFMKPGASIVMVGSEAGEYSKLLQPYRSQIQSAPEIDELEDIVFDPDTYLEMGGLKPGVWAPTYGVSKAMLHRACQLYSKDIVLTDRGLSLNVVCPGPQGLELLEAYPEIGDDDDEGETQPGGIDSDFAEMLSLGVDAFKGLVHAHDTLRHAPKGALERAATVVEHAVNSARPRITGQYFKNGVPCSFEDGKPLVVAHV